MPKPSTPINIRIFLFIGFWGYCVWFLAQEAFCLFGLLFLFALKQNMRGASLWTISGVHLTNYTDYPCFMQESLCNENSRHRMLDSTDGRRAGNICEFRHGLGTGTDMQFFV